VEGVVLGGFSTRAMRELKEEMTMQGSNEAMTKEAMTMQGSKEEMIMQDSEEGMQEPMLSGSATTLRWLMLH
jgi:hypothetical protein